VHALIGLGNPGRSYSKTRHNAGYLLLDYLIQGHLIPFSPGKGDYYFCEYNNLLLIKPTTYMNLSGRAVVQVMQDFSLPKENILVIYDDFHLPFGTFRFRARGSDGGHNGIKSIIYELESAVFDRLKIGIGSTFENSIDFVLSEFNPQELTDLESIYRLVAESISTWQEFGIEQAMNRFNNRAEDTSNN